MATKHSRTREFIKHALIWSIIGLQLFPLYLMFVISFKTNEQFNANPFLPDAISQWQWQNWAKGWEAVKDCIANSIVTAFGAVAFCLLFAVMCAYVLARYRFPGRSMVYYGMIAIMFMPGSAATLVTTIMLFKELNLMNSLWSLVLLGTAGGQVVCVFILRQFIEEIPRELFESAEIDGAGHLRQISHIVLPMSGSVLSTLAIMQFIGNWNSLMLPRIILVDPNKMTVPVGLMSLDAEYVKRWGELMAGYAIGSVPLIMLFIFTMRLFVKGVASGAVKG